MTMPPLPADGDTSWGNGDWASSVHTAASDVITGRLTTASLDEQIRDTAGAAITAGTGISKTVNDAGDNRTLIANACVVVSLDIA